MKNLLFILGLVALIGFGCKPNPPKAVITVTKLNGQVVPDATVRVYAGPSDENTEGNVGYIKPYERERDAVKMTDNEGKAEFEFEYEAIYNVFAFKIENGDTLKGTGAVILEKNKVAEETVIIR